MNDALLCSIMYACDGVRDDGCVKLYIACCRDRKEKSWNPPHVSPQVGGETAENLYNCMLYYRMIYLIVKCIYSDNVLGGLLLLVVTVPCSL